MKYILYKGFIGIDGISLTVGEVTPTRFCVHLIPGNTGTHDSWEEKTRRTRQH